MKNILVPIAIFLYSSTLVFSQNPPSAEGWDSVTKFHYEIKNYISSPVGTVIVPTYVGSANMYKNPGKPGELLMVIVKYPAFTIIPKAIRNEMKSPGNVIENYSQKKKQEEFEKRLKQSDAIAFVKWKESKDPRTGEQMLSGEIESWILDQNGNWFFISGNKPEIRVELVSEASAYGPRASILVGFKIFLESGNHYHVLRFDQNDLISENGGGK